MLDRTDRPARKSRRKSRPERSAAPGQNPHLHVPFIRRRTPPYDILDPASGDAAISGSGPARI